MASKKVNNILDHIKNNTIVKKVYNEINSKKENKKKSFYNYPSLNYNNNEINNFIGLYCPMGYFNINNDGVRNIIPYRKMLTTQHGLSKNLNNFTCANSACNTFNKNSNIIENFANKNNRDYLINIILFILSVLIILFILNKKKV